MIDVNESPLPRQPSLVHLFNAGTIRLVVSIPPMLFSFVEHCEHRPSSLSPHLSLLFIKLLNPHTICLTRYVNMIMIISADSQVSLLYEGEQIFFGRTTDAKAYFVNMGFECPAQQTTPDFLTSLTSASERTPRSGFENKVPRSPQEFAQAWKSSPEYTQLQKDIDSFGEAYPFKGKQYEEFVESRKREKSKHSLVPLFNTSRKANNQFDQIPLHALVCGSNQVMFKEGILETESRTDPHYNSAGWELDHVACHRFRVLQSRYVDRHLQE